MTLLLMEGVSSNLEQDYEIGDLLGEGNFAKVKKARNKKTNMCVAIKFIDKAFVSDIKRLETLISLKNLEHPNIIRLLDVYETSDKYCLIMELASGGGLFNRIIERGSYSERDTSMIMLSIFRAVKYLHEKGVAHGDLKPENILYESDAPGSPVKISDSGLSKVIDRMKSMRCGDTPMYVSPEVLIMRGNGPEVDYWSLGILMYVLLCGFLPFYSDNDRVLFQQIQEGEFEFISPYWDNVSPQAKDLISKLLVVDPKNRCTAAQALLHPWFSMALPTHDLQTEKRLKTQIRVKKKSVAEMMHMLGVKPKKKAG